MSNRTASIMNNCTNIMHKIGSQPCLLCGARARGSILCPGCQDDLPRLPASRCPICALPTLEGLTCGRCLAHPPAFDETRAVFAYTAPVDQVIHELKYSGTLPVARFLGLVMAQALAQSPRPDLLVPMPLHPNRLRERGFNQAAELAKHLARELDIPLALPACVRTRDVGPQAALSLADRHANVRGIFRCNAPLAGQQVALVDDVMTTGASLDALARAAKAAGAGKVMAWVAARTL